MPPHKIGRYEIKREIGRGGMATVYLAYDPRFKRDVAIKVLPSQFLHDPKFRGRFRQEAQAIAALEHSAIVPVHDFGEYENQPYLVMRYMPGGSLTDRLEPGPLSVKKACQLLDRIARAIDTAHSRNVIHRDLKPGNILFDEHGDAYLSDFGIAKLQEGTASFTGSAIIGTPAYMSPEQARGKGTVDARSDIYSLGAVLFRTLTGKVPYEADTPVGQAIMHISEAVPRVRDVRPEVPQAVADVIERAMAKDPAERFGSARAMAQSLHRAGIIPSGDEDTPTFDARPTPLPVLRRRWGWALAGVMVLAVLGWGIYSRAAGDSESTTPTISPVPTVTAAATVISEATAAVVAVAEPTVVPPTETPITPTDTVFPPTDSPVPPTAPVAAMFRGGPERTGVYEPGGPTLGRQLWKFKTGDFVDSSPAISSGMVYFGSYDDHLYALDAGSGQEKWKFKTGDGIWSPPAISGGVVYFGSYDNYLYALDAGSGQEKWKFKTGARVYSSPAISGGVVYFGSLDSHLYALDAGSGQEKWKFDAGSGFYSSPAISGGVVYFGSNDGHLYALDASSGQEKWKFKTGDGIWSSPAISGGVVYFGSTDGHLYAFKDTTDTSVPPTDTPVPPTPEPLAIVNVARGNLRSGPGTVYSVVAQLDEGTGLAPLERTDDSEWFRVEVEATGEEGWISTTIVDINFAAGTLPVAEVIPPTPTPIPPTPTATANPSGRNELPAGTIANIHVNGHDPTFIEVEYDYEWNLLIPDWWLGRGSQSNLSATIVLGYRDLATGEVDSYRYTHVLPGAVRSGTTTKAIGIARICKWKPSGGLYEIESIIANMSTFYSELGTPIPGYPWLNTLEDNWWFTRESIPYTGWQFSCP